MSSGFHNRSSALNHIIMKSFELSVGPPDRYRLCTTRSSLKKNGKIRKWTFGQKTGNMPNKTILLVGETGTGKTTLINTMVNYFLGVKYEDKVWFEITEEETKDQTESITSEITAYEIISEEKPFFLTIIDTPGYGDTRGIDQDMKIAQNLYELFLHETGVKDLDAVCLVLKSSQNRISDRQHYIFEGVLSLFGKDIEDIIVHFITYSDGLPPTDALEAIKKEKITCCHDDEDEPVHFLFNNRQSEKQTKKYEVAYKSFWEMGERSLDEYFKFVNSRQRKSVTLTVSVLNERMQLEACVQSLKERIKYREAKQRELTGVQKALKQNKEQIENDKNFPFTVRAVYKVKVDISGASWSNRKVTSCYECQENCHEFNCSTPINASWCKVMRGGYCTVCKCHSSKHVRENRKYVTWEKEEKVTFEKLKNKYSGKNVSYDQNPFKHVEEEQEKKLKMKEEKTNLESCLKKLLDENEKEKNRFVKEAYETIIKLSEIALKPDSAFTIQHLDFLIPRVEEAGEAEWVQKLRNMQEDAAKSTRSTVGYLIKMCNSVGLEHMKDCDDAQ